MKNFIVKDKVVLITGASSGIGRATAKAFAMEGAKVALVSRDPIALNQVASELNKDTGTIRAEIFPLDLNQLNLIPEIVNKIEKKMGAVDILINCAAYSVGGMLEDCPVEQYKKNFEVNFFAPLKLIQTVLPEMKRRKLGQIINISSGAGYRGFPGASSYCSTKFALNGLTESLRVELRPYGIDVILISPGAVKTNFHSRAEFSGKWKLGFKFTAAKTPEDIANIILKASKKRSREVIVCGPAAILYHLNYWAPQLTDRILAKKYSFET